MCQVTDGDVEELTKRPDLRGRRDCMKCGEKAVVVARIKDPLCRECFLTYFTHRFRATIGKSRLIRDGDKVLVAVSGGQNSCAMLNLIKKGLSVEAQKKLRFVPTLVYIDEGAVIGQSRIDRLANQKAVCKFFDESGFPWHTAALEEVLNGSDTPTISPVPGCHDDSCKQSHDAVADRLDGLRIEEDGNVTKLEELLAHTKSLTAKQDLVHKLRHELLLRLAKQHGCCKVMLGNTSTSLSASILANIAQGRGAAVPLDMGFSDDRHGDVTFVRPMRELTSREVALYNRLCDVESIFIPTLSTKAGEYASINTLTESFINGLQADFPSTVSTVFRTGEKLTVSKDSGSATQDKCALCAAQLDTAVTTPSALSATQMSLKLTEVTGNQPNSSGSTASASAGCANSSNSSTECCGQGDGSCRGSSNQMELPTREQIESCLCYGCRLTVKDVIDVSLLPSYILNEVGKQKRRAQMRDEIQDFLLEDS